MDLDPGNPLNTSNPVLSGLIRKRAELAGELEAVHARIPVLVAALNSVDATIRLFSPDLPLDETAPKRPRPRLPHDLDRSAASSPAPCGRPGSRSRRTT